MKNLQNSEDALGAENCKTYEFITIVSLSSYLPKKYLSLSKAEIRSVFAFQRLFTEFMMAVLEILPERISEPVAQLAREIEKKENAVERSDNSNVYDASSEFSENFRRYRFIATCALADYLRMSHPFDMSKKDTRLTIELHQTWSDCIMEQVEIHHELFTKAVDQLVKEIKKKEKAAKFPQDLTESQPDSEFEELN